MSGELSESTATERSTGNRGGTAGHRHSGGVDHPNERAVSYALGFVVVFSVVVAGTLALFVVGLDVLSDVGRDETIAASEENVDVIHSEVNSLATQAGDRREMHLELVDAQVRFTDSEAVTVRVESDDVALAGVEYDTRALRYEVVPHETTFVYAFGHVYRIDERGDGSALSEKPPAFEVSDGQTRLVVPVLTGPTPGGPTEIGVSGTGEREFVALRSGQRSLSRTGTGAAGVDTIAGTVTIEGTDHPSVWVTALESTGFEAVEVTENPTAVTGQFESDRLTVQQADIAFALGGEESP